MGSSSKYITSLYKMSRGRFMSEMVFRYSAWLMASLSIAGVVGIALGIVLDIRILLVALLLICVVIPMVMMLLYYNLALRRECAVNVLPHQLRIDDDGIAAILYIRNQIKDSDKGEDNSENGVANEDKAEEISQHGSDESELIMLREEKYNYDSFCRVSEGSDSLFLYFKPPMKGFLWLPVSAFSGIEEAKGFIDTLYDNLEMQNPAFQAVTEEKQITEAE